MKRQKPSLVRVLVSHPRILSRAGARALAPIERNEGARRPLGGSPKAHPFVALNDRAHRMECQAFFFRSTW
jgi:hypothetical protein